MFDYVQRCSKICNVILNRDAFVTYCVKKRKGTKEEASCLFNVFDGNADGMDFIEFMMASNAINLR